MSVNRGVLERHAVELLQETNAAQKTQMVPFVSGADVRNRFVHAVEVRSYALSLARAIGLREPRALSLIAETALLHDVGHPPFGHVGERVLDRLALAQGGFESNAHTVHLLLADPRFAPDVVIHSVKHAAVIPEFETAPQPLRKGTYERDRPELDRQLRNEHCIQLVRSIVDVADTLANAALDLVDIAAIGGLDHVPEARNHAHRQVESWIGAISAAHRRADDGPLRLPQAVETDVEALTRAARALFIDTELNADIDAVITTTIERALQQLDARPARAATPPCGCHPAPLAHIIQPMSEQTVIELAGTGHLFAALFPNENWWPLGQATPISQTPPIREATS